MFVRSSINRNHGRNGFTLVELLVVISIIAVLSAILFPVFTQAKQAAKTASCLSNMKQIATGQLMYLTDNDGSFEDLQQGGCVGLMGQIGTPSTWMDDLTPYTSSRSVFLCPSGNASSNSTTLNYLVYPPVYPSTNIGMNSYLGLYYNYFQYFIQDQCEGPGTPGGGGPGDGAATPRYDNNVRYPSATAMFTDGFEEPAAYGFDTAWWIDPGFGVGSPYGISDRHDQRSNVAFFDGHVKSYISDSLVSQTAINDVDLIYVEQTNYNAAKVIWDVDAANPYDQPGKWPSNCCSN